MTTPGIARPALRLAAAATLALGLAGLVGCSTAGAPAAPAPAAETNASAEAAFDLTTGNLDTRPHIEAVPEAVAALQESGFTPVQAGKLTVALGGAGAPPTSFFAEDDAQTIIGSDADFASLLAEGLGLEYAPENVAWADWPLGIESGKYDIALTNVGVTEERKELFDFATYRDAVMGFSVAAGSEITEISEPADVSGLRVIVGSGTNQEKFLLDWFDQNEAAGLAPGEAVYYEDSAAGSLALASGRADVSIDPHSLAAFREATLGETRVVGSFNSAYPVNGQVGAVTAKGNGLIEPVALVFSALLSDGTYDEVLERWGQEEEAVTESLINPPGLPKP
ncbi:transporter substrate-binding domain-containing protein [Leucobacter luti]|uniref:Amino acid ABC transporter substrate-binding protein (PAAT family) n=1 Tax=Leucobacter luti TaxID=340320 RepID=A0A4Q7U2H5_9MICO|nr:transporter substrate-binding domain-containing protein [Leucobacter luti]MBL3699340.1 ABC transporter substrate-binding protein [Leucobacter luti]RZT66850.1 amino acid ABC transporter substrate-binding protein (PAAT family) [Leucobacter luti]